MIGGSSLSINASRSVFGHWRCVAGPCPRAGRSTRTPTDPKEAAGRGTPKLPEHLTAAERIIWAHVVTTMPKGIVAGCDDLVLEGLCVQAARFREAERQIRIQACW